jgi:two-component system, chemotaxis family, chemotaxis protein CheY
VNDQREILVTTYRGETRLRVAPHVGGGDEPRELGRGENFRNSELRLILIVDDDPAIRSTVSEILDMEGYPVQTAANGQEALSKVRATRPWLIILDMRMPIMDGWAFARTLQEEGIKIPILVMTAAQNARRWAEEIGANAYIPKPFDLDELLNAVNKFIEPPPTND